MTPRRTRVRLTSLMPGADWIWCQSCKERIRDAVKFGKREGRYVHAIVYKSGKWVCDEFWHQNCYLSAGSPHGSMPRFTQPATVRGATSRSIVDSLFADA